MIFSSVDSENNFIITVVSQSWKQQNIPIGGKLFKSEIIYYALKVNLEIPQSLNYTDK